MTEPDEIEFHEHVSSGGGAQPGRPLGQSVPVRLGIVAGSAVLVVIGAVAAMGASPAPSASTANPNAGTIPAAPFDEAVPGVGAFGGPGFAFRDGGGFRAGPFRDITISAIDGSNLSLKTDDGWTRTITVGSSTTISKGGQAVRIGDLKVGDQIAFAETRASEYRITEYPAVGRA